MITRLGSRVVYENRWMRVREDDVRLADGSPSIYGYVDKPDFVMVIPIEGEFTHLVRQYRYPLQAWSWEFPQGAWEDRPDADPVELGHGELREETGFTAGQLRRLGYLHEAGGFCSQGFTIFVATELTPGPTALSIEETGLRTERFRLTDVAEMIRRGQIKDAPTVAAFGLLLLDRA